MNSNSHPSIAASCFGHDSIEDLICAFLAKNTHRSQECEWVTKEQVQGFVNFQVTTIPLGRVGTTDEIAKGVVSLASDDSSFVNGIGLFEDGGMAQI